MNEPEFIQTLQKFQTAITRTIFHMVHSTETARDLSQEVFIRLWENRKKIRADRPIFSFLYRIAINLSVDFLRKVKPEYSKSDLDDFESPENPDHRELFELICMCTQYLHPQQRAIFILRDIEGLEFKDIKNIIGTSPGALQSNLYLARQQMRRLLAEKFQIEKEYVYEM